MFLLVHLWHEIIINLYIYIFFNASKKKRINAFFLLYITTHFFYEKSLLFWNICDDQTYEFCLGFTMSLKRFSITNLYRSHVWIVSYFFSIFTKQLINQRFKEKKWWNVDQLNEHLLKNSLINMFFRRLQLHFRN